ncbi:hypothetical protein BOO25_18670 [Vibrio navarrensis]|uniref:hypothetical protein n=1 Tax=Vibrio navarrensis TaxID=29495 RepID=UPI00192F9516|nr:hypothetical protein [Vibrio navarrensis]MBE3670954.1 hypothetical protein [Vibrio navarrensis]
MSNKKYVYEGLEGLVAIGASVGVSERTIKRRMEQHGLSLEEAIDRIKEEQGRKAKRVISKQAPRGPRFPEAMSRSWRTALGIGSMQ